MMTAYLARRTWLHAVPAGAKLAGLAAFCIALFPVSDWRILAGLVLVACAAQASLGGEALRQLSFLKPLLPLLLIVGVLQALGDSWQAASASVARLVLMVVLANMVSMTTTMQDLMNALAPVVAPLRFFGLNPKKLALAVALVVRFVPVLLANWRAREEAWRARTGRRASLRLIGPFLVETLRLADHVAEALDARGFDLPQQRR